MGDELVPLVRLAPAGCSPRLLQVLDWAMAVRPQDRPQSVAQFREALAGRGPVPLAAGVDGAAPADGAGFEKTVQVSSHGKTIKLPRDAAAPPPRPPPAGTPRPPAPAARSRHDEELETPERSVMLPPKSQSPLKTLLLLLVLAALAAGGWTTRQEWMPAMGLKTAALPAARFASAPDAGAASVAAAASVAVAQAASDAASQAEVAASAVAAAAPASEPASAVPLEVVESAPPARPAKVKSTPDAHGRALAARIAALTLPPPVLPPADEGHVVAPGQPAARPVPEAPVPAAASTPSPTAAVPRAQGPRELCAELDKKKAGSCIKQMCENERYQGYPICQRLLRLEQRKQGASE